MLPTLKVVLDQTLRQNFAGAVLISTVQKLKLPVSGPENYIFPDVSPGTSGAAVDAIVDAGYGSEFVQYGGAPTSRRSPTGAQVQATLGVEGKPTSKSAFYL